GHAVSLASARSVAPRFVFQPSHISGTDLSHARPCGTHGPGAGPGLQHSRAWGTHGPVKPRVCWRAFCLEFIGSFTSYAARGIVLERSDRNEAGVAPARAPYGRYGKRQQTHS